VVYRDSQPFVADFVSNEFSQISAAKSNGSDSIAGQHIKEVIQKRTTQHRSEWLRHIIHHSSQPGAKPTNKYCGIDAGEGERII
jgi:hypothetical protein